MVEERDERETQYETQNAADTGETGGEESFAELFEKTSGIGERLAPGQKVSASVVGITGDYVYVDLGGKSEGIIALAEFTDENGDVSIEVGDQVEAYFVNVVGGSRKLTTLKRGYSTINLAEIRDAYNAGVPVTGRVTKEIKGGYEVMIGKVRAFCPGSQIDLRGSKEGPGSVGQELSFQVLEFSEDGPNIILSRKALLLEEREKAIEELKKNLEVGQVIPVTVRSVQKFGIFADMGGIEGLIPISEVAWGGVENLKELFSPGQELTVKVLSIDWERNRITLSLKEMQENPWTNVNEKYAQEMTVRGTVARITAFGAFVNLEPGIDGLVHISKLGAGRKINHPGEVLEVGQVVDAYVENVDAGQKRISLTLEPVASKDPKELPALGELLEATVERIMPYGVFVRFGDEMKGLVPNSETGTPRGTNLSRVFPEGTKLKVLVKEVDRKRGRVTLSLKGVEEKQEEEEIAQYQRKLEDEIKSSDSLGSLGEILKAKLNIL